ncbi:KICSTOR complex protein SZT2-like [Agrilus planipennis]|uniref:KICSTOR complex protein SZT2-like n=1 Tax=Agrilus planipennis TaxID=224129 RepID=A0A7F5R1Q6_AGRPL|nr:KICSTOR complex protein SZT2-like [Agrilus planipennis]
MEPNFQRQDSDEGVDLSSLNGISDNYLTDFSYSEDPSPFSFARAVTVYILLPKNVPVSRADRLLWFLDRINTIITFTDNIKLDDDSNELKIVSIVPAEALPSKTNRYLITVHTQVKFLAHRYRLVYCIDMSPSQSAVDVQKGEILFDEILKCFRNSLEGICKEFIIPGSSIVHKPILYLTVIVNTPFFMNPAQQVLVKGVIVSSCNFEEIISLIEAQFYYLEGRIAQVSTLAHEQIELLKAENEGMVGSLFDLHESENVSSTVPMVLPDVNFVNMLRYSMLAISLLPENCLSHILVITDGVVAMPDSNIMESLLLQLHYDGTPVSFLKIGSPFHPNSSAGYIPYTDLLHFLSQSTMGTCLDTYPQIRGESDSFNIYHNYYLVWSFFGNGKYDYSFIFETQPCCKWILPNQNFENNRVPTILSKKQVEESINASFLLLLSRRMREGYTLDDISRNNGIIEVKLNLQWKPFTYIQYRMTSQWPCEKNSTNFEVQILAPYEFLHDITCLMKKEIKSSYRQAVIERFWMRLSQLSTGDSQLAQHFTSFMNSTVWYTLPESVRNGIPLFAINGNDATKLSLSPCDPSCPKFVSAWQPICQIETNNWRKWFHTHKLSLILKHDHPLPRHMHLTNSSRRFQVVQCRQAATALYGLLAEWATFVLIDNHTYLKFVYFEDIKIPSWFCLVRVTSKLPCAVLNFGFVNNTPGFQRYRVVEELKIQLSYLSYLSSPLKVRESVCCTLLQKPLEKILIRYERKPSDLSTVIFPDGTQPPQSLTNFASSPLTSTLFTTLSRYLYHRRWIWSTSHNSNPKLEEGAISRVLSTLSRIRLKEGFNIAHSSSGILTMVLELQMEPVQNCIIQYVLFPPHSAWKGEEFTSSSEEDAEVESELESELQIVTEVWVEPQYGTVSESSPKPEGFGRKRYYELADVLKTIDWHCINSLLTLEHLNLMCQEISKPPVLPKAIPTRRFSTLSRQRKISNCKSSKTSLPDLLSMGDFEAQINPSISQRIQHIPFNFDPIGLLQFCFLTELLFSMFVDMDEERPSSLSNYDFGKPNKILLEALQDNLQSLHDREIDISPEDSDRFTRHIINRHPNKRPKTCPISPSTRDHLSPNINCISRWRCFIKGISITHAILTFVPATLDDIRFLVSPHNEKNIICSEKKSGLPLPLYVFDCPLAALVECFVNGSDQNRSQNDIYDDHRHKVNLEKINERLSTTSQSSSTETKTEETENTDQRTSSQQHCRALVLTYSKCFVLSLFSSLQCGASVHESDVHFAIDQCKEVVYDVDITQYIQTICGHLKNGHDSEKVDLNIFQKQAPCRELKSLHRLIKYSFLKILNTAFSPIPSDTKYYYCHTTSCEKAVNKNDSDDELSSVPPSGVGDLKQEKEPSIESEVPLQFTQSENTNSECIINNTSPLFLQLICMLVLEDKSTECSITVLPTCLGEVISGFQIDMQKFDNKALKVYLGIKCLTLPTEVINVINDYSSKGLRTTSFCSEGFQPSIDGTLSDGSSMCSGYDPLGDITEEQRKAIAILQDEIKWLLRDEIATALLDMNPVTPETLNFVINHVIKSPGRSSCILDRVDLHFVYESHQSHEKFVKDFKDVQVPNYKIYALPIQNASVESFAANYILMYHHQNQEMTLEDTSKDIDYQVKKIKPENEQMSSPLSSASLSSGSNIESDGGYDEDVSEDDEDYGWLENMNNRRCHLPNFWLIMTIEKKTVTFYFHCRFLGLPAPQVATYLQVQRTMREIVKELCKQVNQSLLLQSLHDTRVCDLLLEPDDDPKEWNYESSLTSFTSKPFYNRFKNLDDTNDEMEMYPQMFREAETRFKAGYFSCPVTWEKRFVLHPRLKIGPGKSGLSRGIKALKTILDKFSVSNRSNMFVYQDINSNVFYLRLHECVQGASKTNVSKSNDFENTSVSRSPSITSLPLSQQKRDLAQSENSISSTTSSDIRPRVRSFGEKDGKEEITEDTLILKVHGITQAGKDVCCELVQVLQKRLDDAVLEFLSVMLARNAMCPLTPEDVKFLQKPYQPPELVIKLSIQDYALKYLDSFSHYLKQNLLQFLNIPKYTDSRPQFHFKDYTECDLLLNKDMEDNIFIYNQSQSVSSGSRAIVCIALAIIKGSDNITDKFDENFGELFKKRTFEEIVATSTLDEVDPFQSYLEFRLWKQGRVNTENLHQKLQTAVQQAAWDIVMEYYILQHPLCTADEDGKYKSLSNHSLMGREIQIKPIKNFTSEEIICNVFLDNKCTENIPKVLGKHQEKLDFRSSLISRQKRTIPIGSTARRCISFDDYREKDNPDIKKIPAELPVLNLEPHESGDSGVMTEICSDLLPDWLEFGNNIQAVAVRKIAVPLVKAHLLYITVKELVLLISQFTHLFPKVFSSILVEDRETGNYFNYYVPYSPGQSPKKCIIISRNFEQWKASISCNTDLAYLGVISTQTLKHSQKFTPVITPDKKFVPRQKIFWASVKNDNIVLYTYNWPKDNVDKLTEYINHFGMWLNMRAGILASVTAQKLGLFHNQVLSRKTIPSTNPYFCAVGDVEAVLKFSKDKNKRGSISSTNNPISFGALDVFRDAFHNIKQCYNDPVAIFTMEMHELKKTDKKHKEELKKLHCMWQSRTSSSSESQIQILKQNARVIHFCFTPFLFLPRWRVQAAATRDHSLNVPLLNNKIVDHEDDSWHYNLCATFITEYQRYLQGLGFVPLQIDNSLNANEKKGIQFIHKDTFYFQKTMLGGILIFTMKFSEPFLATKLYAIECSRLQTASSRTAINQFTLSFIDECDRIKVFMHLHSFTYDFHLRCVHDYVSNGTNSKICDKFDLTNFLDDFMKYYNKGPNFAQNLVHEETVVISDLLTEGKQLYDYLLFNIGQYKMKTFTMRKNESKEDEYVLVQVSNMPQMSYKDSQDCQQTDDFDITVIITRLNNASNFADNVLVLKYYVILISRREIYPKLETDRKLGKFRTVSSSFHCLTKFRKFQDSEETPPQIDLNVERSLDEPSVSKLSESGSYKETEEKEGSKNSINSLEESLKGNSNERKQICADQYVEIKQEAVNYLGYYSSHEQLMQKLMFDQANSIKKQIQEMVEQGMVDCRTHILWNKLASRQDSNTLTYSEFMELKGLARLENLSDIQPNLASLLNQPLSWYQGLAKLLVVKYGENIRSFISPDKNIQHYVVLHYRYDGAFMLLSMDLHTSRGDLYGVYRTSHSFENSDTGVIDRKALFDGFVRCVCYYIWSGLL